MSVASREDLISQRGRGEERERGGGGGTQTTETTETAETTETTETTDEGSRLVTTYPFGTRVTLSPLLCSFLSIPNCMCTICAFFSQF
jgi:hypothetical protein